MNTTVKSRDYHRAYQKWDKLLLEGKADELVIVPSGKSDVLFTVTLKKCPASNSGDVLAALGQLPDSLPSLEEVREDYDGNMRL
jgi:hypothetical protein